MLSAYARNALILGLLAAIAPFSMDMYLPAMPVIAHSLSTTTAATQMTIMSYFIGFGLSQIIYGPLSDMYGRKMPMYVGLSIFVVACVGCAFAPNIEALIAFRLLQGLGGASVMVIPRAIIRDYYTGIEATKLMSTMMLVISVSPILAPLIGSFLIDIFGWRAIFMMVAIIGAIGFLLTIFALPETWPKQRRVKTELKTVLASYKKLLRHKRFMGVTLIGGLGMSGFFSMLACASFVYIDHFGLTPKQFGLCFALNAIGFIGASQFGASLGQRFGMAHVIFYSSAIYALITGALFLVTLSGIDHLYVMMSFLLPAFACAGLIVPLSMVLALDEQGNIAGMASALVGMLQMILGGVVIALIGHFFDGTSLVMVLAIALAALGSFLISILVLRQNPGKK